MLLKKFSCNWFSFGIWRKMTFRYWPLWAGYLAFWLLAGPEMLDRYYYEAEDIATGLSLNAFYFGRSLIGSLNGSATGIALYAGMVGLAVYSYMYQSRSVNLFHSLPVRRETLFVTNFLTGLGFIVGPNLILTGYFALIGLMRGGVEPVALLTWFAVTTLVAIFFFGLATLCAVGTGTILMMPVLYGIFNFLVVVLESVLRWLASMFLWGVTGGDMFYQKWSPLVYILDKGLENNRADCTEYLNSSSYIKCYVRFEDWGYVLLLGLVGLLFAAVALWLYRRWQSESAGDLMAFGFLRPVFTYVWAAGCSLMLGSFLFVLLGEGDILGWLFGYTGADYGMPSVGASLLFVLCMMMGGTVGYFSALMLHRKSFRVFHKKDWRGYGAFVLALLALVLCIKGDVFGIESWTPDAEQVKSVTLDGHHMEGEEIAAVIRMHKTILSQREELQAQLEAGSRDDKTYFRSVRFRYVLENGRRVTRQYTLPINVTLAADPTTPTGMYYAMTESVEKRLQRLGLADITQPSYGKVYFYYNLEDKSGLMEYCLEVTDDEKLLELLNALKKDVAEGTLGSDWIFDEMYDKYGYGDFWAEISLGVANGPDAFCTVGDNAPNTLEVLKQQLKEHLNETRPDVDIYEILAGVKK